MRAGEWFQPAAFRKQDYYFFDLKNVRNYDQFDKFKSLAVLYDKQNFNCFNQESFCVVLYSCFSMLIVQRKMIQTLHNLLGTLPT